MHNAGLLTLGMVGRSIAAFAHIALLTTLLRALRYDGPVTKAMVFYVAAGVSAILWNMLGVAEYLTDFLPGLDLIDITVDYAFVPQIAVIPATVNLIVAIRGWPWTRYPHVSPIHKVFTPEAKEGEEIT